VDAQISLRAFPPRHDGPLDLRRRVVAVLPHLAVSLSAHARHSAAPNRGRFFACPARETHALVYRLRYGGLLLPQAG
jgi:hypothetical protein